MTTCNRCDDPSTGTINGEPLCEFCLHGEQIDREPKCGYCGHSAEPLDQIGTCGDGECRAWATVDTRDDNELIRR